MPATFDPTQFKPDPRCEDEEHDPTSVVCICFRRMNL